MSIQIFMNVCFYIFTAAMIRGNRANCAQFAQSYRLDWLVSRLESQQSSTGILYMLFRTLSPVNKTIKQLF